MLTCLYQQRRQLRLRLYLAIQRHHAHALEQQQEHPCATSAARVHHIAPHDALHEADGPRRWLAMLASPALVTEGGRLRAWIRLEWLASVSVVGAVAWSRRLQVELGRRALLTQLTHYMSTLGGAHAQLGDGSRQHARRAALRARQLGAVACALGDASLAWRCRAFFAQSCIQRGGREQGNSFLL